MKFSIDFLRNILYIKKVRGDKKQMFTNVVKRKVKPPVEEFPKFYTDNLDIVRAQRLRFKSVNEMSLMVIMNNASSLIISGPAGCGKTYGVEKLLEEMSRKRKCQVATIKGYAKATGIYSMLYRMRKKNQVLLIDDCDSIFRDENALNILKAALDTSPVRKISWRSQAALKVEDETGEKLDVPKEFVYEGSVIFLTNLDFDGEIAKDTKLAPHFEALLSRSHYISINIKTAKERLLRVLDVALAKSGMFKHLKPNVRADIVLWMIEKQNKLREVSLRTAVKIGDLAATTNNWKSIASITLLKE